MDGCTTATRSTKCIRDSGKWSRCSERRRVRERELEFNSDFSAPPRTDSMPYDAGLAARMADCLAAIGERRIRQKNVFGGRGFLVGKLTFAIAWTEGIIVKVPR